MSTEHVNFVDLIPLELIILDPTPLRRELDFRHIKDLTESFNLLKMGPLDPLIVKPLEKGKYQILSGNHRYMALKRGGWKEAPCHIIDPMNEEEEFLMKLHTNTKRKNLSSLEACEALVREKEIYETLYPQTKHGHNAKRGLNVQSAHSKQSGYVEIKSKALKIDGSTLRRDLQVGHAIQEIPELKEAKASKTQVLLVAQQTPEEKQALKEALQASKNKSETLKNFIKNITNPTQPLQENLTYCHLQETLRILKEGIETKGVCLEGKLFDLINQEILLDLSELAKKEHERLSQMRSNFQA